MLPKSTLREKKNQNTKEEHTLKAQKQNHFIGCPSSQENMPYDKSYRQTQYLYDLDTANILTEKYWNVKLVQEITADSLRQKQ